MKKEMRRKFFYGLQRKIIFAVTLIISMLFSVTYIGVNQIVKTDMYELLTEQYSYLNERLQNSLEVMKENLDQLTSNFILNEYVQKSLTNQIFTTSDLEMMKKGLAYQNKSFMDYYLIIDNKKNCYGSKEVALDMENFEESVIYQSLKDEYSQTKILWTKDMIFGTEQMSFFAVRYIHEMNSHHKPGILILKLNDSILDGVREAIDDEQLFYFILDENQQICFSQIPQGENGEALLQEILENQRSSSKKDLSKGIVNSNYDETTGFTVITYAPREVSNAIVWQIQKMMALIFGVTYVLTIFVIIVYTRKMTRPIKELSDTMIRFDETRLDERVELNTNTELDTIGTAYNNMVDEVKDLMEAVKKKERELRESELNSLMYQIRPHFLYNTLDNIYMLARIQKEETIMRMIQALSRFLRINLSNGKEEISVEKELEHVESYLEIQKIRNAELFTYKITCEPAIQSLPVMKMILQPVAENCIKYGFRDIYEGGEIIIRAFQEKDFLCFSIENNGEPISREQVEKLNRLETISMEEMDSVIQKRNGGYGISNVVKRLRMRYEKGIRFYYLRKETGTECIIKIRLDNLQEEII